MAAEPDRIPADVQELRSYFRDRNEHHSHCNTRFGKPCDCYAYGDAKAHTLLDQIEAALIAAAKREAQIAETLEAYREANDLISRIGHVDRLNRAIDVEAKRGARLTVELVEAVKLLEPFADVTVNGLGKSGYYSDLDTITNEDCNAAAAFVQRHATPS